MSRAPTQTAEEALAACIRQCGRRVNAEVTSENRTAVRKWLVAEGIPSAYVQTLSLSTLAGVYKDETNGTLAALRAMSRNAPDKSDDAEEIEEIEGDEPEPEIADKPAEEPTEPKPVRTKNNGQTEAQRKLLEAMQAFTAANANADLDEARVISLIKTHAPKPENLTYRIELKRPDMPTITDEAKPRHAVFERVLRAVAAKRNVYLVGPAGCGKTHICGQVSETLRLEYRFSGAVASEYKLLGYNDAQGRTVRTLYMDWYEKGGVFLADEIDASSASALLSINAGLANGHQDFPHGMIARHADAFFIAAANTYGHGADRQYVGRNQLDAASLDRFFVIPMDYDEKLERALYGDNAWTTFVQKARAAVRRLNIRHVVSMRAIADGHAMLAAGETRENVEAGALWKHLTPADVTKVRSQMGH